MPRISELESLTLDRDTLHYKDIVAQRYAELVYFGQWFTPLREALRCVLCLDAAKGHRLESRSSSTRAT